PPRRRATARSTPAASASSSVSQAVKASLKTADASNTEETCAICLDDLPAKRSLQFEPCKHAFHRTCAIHFLESRDNRAKQVCPLCRMQTLEINEKGLSRKNTYLTFKDQTMPNRRFIFVMAHKFSEVNISTVIFYLKEKNRVELVTVRGHRSIAASNIYVNNIYNTAYVNDIAEEIKKLEKRDLIYRQMIKVFRNGGMRNDFHVVREWNYAIERKLASVVWSEYPDYAESVIYYSSDSDLDEDDEDGGVNRRECAVASEFRAYRSHLIFPEDGVPTKTRSRAAAIAAEFTTSISDTEADIFVNEKEDDDDGLEEESQQEINAVEATVNEFIAEEVRTGSAEMPRRLISQQIGDVMHRNRMEHIRARIEAIRQASQRLDSTRQSVAERIDEIRLANRQLQASRQARHATDGVDVETQPVASRRRRRVQDDSNDDEDQPPVRRQREILARATAQLTELNDRLAEMRGHIASLDDLTDEHSNIDAERQEAAADRRQPPDIASSEIEGEPAAPATRRRGAVDWTGSGDATARRANTNDEGIPAAPLTRARARRGIASAAVAAANRQVRGFYETTPAVAAGLQTRSRAAAEAASSSRGRARRPNQ
ncbi:hypothetical protein PENTCL1PPCAC_9819, partial [Pristionchus entomophagus]